MSDPNAGIGARRKGSPTSHRFFHSSVNPSRFARGVAICKACGETKDFASPPISIIIDDSDRAASTFLLPALSVRIGVSTDSSEALLATPSDSTPRSSPPSEVSMSRSPRSNPAAAERSTATCASPASRGFIKPESSPMPVNVPKLPELRR